MAVITLLDSDPLQARLITDNLEAIGCQVVWSQRGWDSLLVAHRIHPDMMLVDCHVPQWAETLTLIRALRGFNRMPILVLASHCPSSYHLRKLTISRCICKPFDTAVLISTVQQILVMAPGGIPYGPPSPANRLSE